MIKNWIKKQALKIPPIKSIVSDRDRLKGILANCGCYPPGHYYSPIPNIKDILQRKEIIFNRNQTELGGIDLNEKGQVELLNKLKIFYKDLPFDRNRKDECLYWLDNDCYAFSDGILLFLMMRYLKPKQVIEVGSGHSSCCMLDTNRLFLGNKANLNFIEPNPSRFYSLTKGVKQDLFNIFQDKLENIPLHRFKLLEANDILFIDSTHVSKIGSDVNRIFFEILPSLNSGVYIHFHDIFYPFEYPLEWLTAGRVWNENYLLRAFLQYNKDFKIVMFNTYLQKKHRDFFNEYMPLCFEKPSAPLTIPGSIWLQKR